MTGGVCTLAGDFLSLLWDVEWYLLFKDAYLLSWDGLLEIRYTTSPNRGDKSGKIRKHVVLNVDGIWNS